MTDSPYFEPAHCVHLDGLELPVEHGMLRSFSNFLIEKLSYTEKSMLAAWFRAFSFRQYCFGKH